MKKDSWLRAGMSAWTLGVEASTVIALRLMKLARGGPAAKAEARRMVNEKIKANLDLQAKAMTGRLGRTPEKAVEKAVAHYLPKVKANRRRLTGDKRRP
jgi:hypothetical protein